MPQGEDMWSQAHLFTTRSTRYGGLPSDDRGLSKAGFLVLC